MKIKVEVKNELLGDSLFWEGEDNEVDDIPNLPARQMAKQVALDGKTRKFGMWVVSEIKD